jgi:hypothetical protein
MGVVPSISATSTVSSTVSPIVTSAPAVPAREVVDWERKREGRPNETDWGELEVDEYEAATGLLLGCENLGSERTTEGVSE